MSTLIQTKDEFFLFVKTGQTIIKFTASWCKPCQAMEPILAEIESTKNIMIGEIDVEKNPGLAEEYGVQGLPLLAFYKDNQLRTHLQGGKNKTEILLALRV